MITSWEALMDQANVHEDQSVLIHAGAGGVGHVAVQIARARGGKFSRPCQRARG